MIENKLLSFVNNPNFVTAVINGVNKFNKTAKTILFIESYGSAVSLLKRGLELGFNIILLTANSDLRLVASEVIQSVHLTIQINTVNEDDLIQIAKLLKMVCAIHAVIPGFEYFVPMATRLSHYFELTSIDQNNVLHFRNKAVMRTKLSAANIAIPKYFIINSIDELHQAVDAIGFPAICKPVDAAGSVNVKRVINKQEAVFAARRILYGEDILWGYPLSKQLLYEEYIDGKEYSLEGTITNGNILYFSVTEKFLADQIEFIEIGHIVNPPLKTELKNQMIDYVNQVIAVLRPNNCAFHAEIRITRDGKPILMEIAARLAGDKIGDLINLSHGINYYDYIFSAYFGEKKSRPSLQNNIAGIRFFYRPDIDVFPQIANISNIDDHTIHEIKFYYQPNEVIPSFPKPLRRLGHVIVKNNDYASLLKSLTDIDLNTSQLF